MQGRACGGPHSPCLPVSLSPCLVRPRVERRLTTDRRSRIVARMAETLRLMVLGAHPDDADYKAGGLAALYARLGHEVRFISVTDGSAGHHELSGPALAARRRAEAEAAGAVVGLS